MKLLRSRHFSLSLFLAGMFPALLTLFSFTRKIVFKHRALFVPLFFHRGAVLPFFNLILFFLSVLYQFLCLKSLEYGLFHSNLFVSDRSDGFHRIAFLPQYPYHPGEMLERLTRIEHGLFHWNLFVSDRSHGFHRITFIHQYLIWLKFFEVSHE